MEMSGHKLVLGYLQDIGPKKNGFAFPFRHLSYYDESSRCLFYRNPFPYVWHYVAIQLEMTSVPPLLQTKSLWCLDVTSHPAGPPLAVTCSFRHMGGGKCRQKRIRFINPNVITLRNTICVCVCVSQHFGTLFSNIALLKC